MNPRIFVAERQLHTGDRVVVRGEDGHHLSRVLRLRLGERVAVAATENVYEGEVTDTDSERGEVVVQLLHELKTHEPRVKVYLAQALPKGDKLEHVLQHGTELGLAGYLVFPGERSIVQVESKKLAKRLERWRRIVRESSSQAQRDIVAPVEYADSAQALQSAIRQIAPGLILFLDEAEQSRSLRQALPEATESLLSPIVLCVGPEGGWSSEERLRWCTEFGAVAVTLGPRILRTETVGLVAGTAVLYHFQSLEG